MAEMIKNYVIPQLKADGLATKIQLGEPCFRPSAIRHFPPVLDDPEARKHISVLGVHGYDFDQYSSLTELHNKYPEYPIWMTEVCHAGESLFPPDYPFVKKPPIYDFADGELWGKMIVGFQNTDRSIVLNIINNGDETDCKILWLDKMVIQKLKAHSITTLIWN